jgi:glutaredoxin
MIVTFYTRRDCCLCVDAYAALERVRQQHPFELCVVDLDSDAGADKHAAYSDEVPVVELDGRKLMKYRVDEARLVRHLSAASIAD